MTTTPKPPRKGYEVVKLSRGDGTLRWFADRRRWRLEHSINGTPFVEWGLDHDDCKAKRDARRARLRGDLPAVTGPMTIAAMFAEWLVADTTTHGAGVSTLEGNTWAAGKIIAVGGHRDAITITSVGAREILVELSRSYKSTPKLRSVFNQALQHLVDTGRRASNPLAGAKRIKSDADLANPTEWLIERQAVETLAYFSAHPSREHAALAVSMLAGPRPGEACALSWTEVDFRRGEITIDYTVDRDTGEASPKLKTDHHGERHRRAAHRTVPMVPQLAAILERHRRDQMAAGDASGYVFAKDGGPLHPQDLFYASKAVSTALGHVSHMTGEPCHVPPNGYRHTFASRLAARSFPAADGAALMGHVDSTQWNKTYTHPTVRTGDINIALWLAQPPVEAVA